MLHAQAAEEVIELVGKVLTRVGGRLDPQVIQSHSVLVYVIAVIRVKSRNGGRGRRECLQFTSSPYDLTSNL
jgi:hypothetical protein